MTVARRGPSDAAARDSVRWELRSQGQKNYGLTSLPFATTTHTQQSLLRISFNINCQFHLTKNLSLGFLPHHARHSDSHRPISRITHAFPSPDPSNVDQPIPRSTSAALSSWPLPLRSPSPSRPRRRLLRLLTVLLRRPLVTRLPSSTRTARMDLRAPTSRSSRSELSIVKSGWKHR